LTSAAIDVDPLAVSVFTFDQLTFAAALAEPDAAEIDTTAKLDIVSAATRVVLNFLNAITSSPEILESPM
jgi:hypothetical protein